MISLHPSGYAVEFADNAKENLTNDNGGFHKSTSNKSRRGRFHDVVSSLYAQKGIRLFLTFTVPPQQTNFAETDTYYSAQFSKLLDLLKINHKRKLNGKGIDQFVWVAESQHRGNIHFHLVTNTQRVDIKYIQRKWDNLVNNGKPSNSFDVQTVRPKDDVRNISAYFAKYMSKSIAHGKEKNEGLKNRIIFCKSFNYSRGFKVIKHVTLTNEEFQQYEAHIIATKRKQYEFKDENEEIKKFEVITHYVESDVAMHLCKFLLTQ